MLFVFDLCLLRKCEGHSNRYAALTLFRRADVFVLFVFDLCMVTTCGVSRGISNQLGALGALFH